MPEWFFWCYCAVHSLTTAAFGRYVYRRLNAQQSASLGHARWINAVSARVDELCDDPEMSKYTVCRR